jgi:hypothetical protein
MPLPFSVVCGAFSGKMNAMILSKTILLALFATAISLLLSCSLPENIEPAQWKMHLEIPVVDRKIPVGTMLPPDPFEGYTVNLGDSIAPADTITLTKTDSMAYDLQQPLGTTDATIFTKTLGPCKIQNMALINFSLQLKSCLPRSQPCNVPFASPLTLSLPQTQYKINEIQSITFDETSPPFDITVTNFSESVDLENTVITLLNESEAVAVIQIAHMPAGSSRVVSVAVAGKSLQSTITFAVGTTLAQGSVVRTNDRLEIQFSLNNLVVSEAVLKDNLIEYSCPLSGDIVIADSLQIKKIAINHTFLECEISSPARLKMEIKGTFDNIGRHSFSDSGGNLGPKWPAREFDAKDVSELFILDTLFEQPGNAQSNLTIPIRAMTLYPSWDPLTEKSFIVCRFDVRSLPDGRMVHFSKSDELSIKILPFRFPFISAEGCLLKPIDQSTTVNIKTGLASSSLFVNSLHHSLYFQSARLRFDVNTGLSQGNSIDSMLVSVTMKDKRGNEDSAMVTKKISGLYAGCRPEATMDFTGVFNRWPDTLAFDTRLIVPSGTGISLFNPNYGGIDSAPFIRFNPVLTWTVTIPLCWKVIDTLRVELDKTEIKLENEQLKWLQNLKEPRVRILLDVTNQTSLNFSLFAIAAASVNSEELMSFPDSLIGVDGFESRLSGRLFSIFDHGGLQLSRRGGQSAATVTLDNRGVGAFLSPGPCVIRWFIIAPTKDAGAILATDYCTLKATGIIDGIGYTDTLPSFQ